MNPERLLQHFDRISEAPDAIPRLRQFILDLAVRGKLVEQDPNDEPASELLKRIQAEKARLVKEGKIRRQDAMPAVLEDEQPFTAPASWAWERLVNVSRKIHYGFTASANATIKAVRLLRITDIQDNSVNWDSVPGCEVADEQIDQFKLEAGDILIARTGGTIGKSFLVSEFPVTAVFASYLIRVQGATILYDRYLKLFIESPVYWKQLEDGTRGAGQPNVNGQTLGRMAVPLPPLAEQHRIVAKVDELMALCDQLEAAKTEREQSRDRLVAASLHRLNFPTDTAETDAPDLPARQADAFRDHARFAFNHLPRLTTRPEHIKQLRQTILNLAVRGKLVPQDPNDEPASELLKRIQAEKARLVKEGKISREKPLLPAGDDELAFGLKPGWQTTRISQILVELQTGPFGSSLHQSDYQKGGIPVINPASIKNERLVPIDGMAVGPATLERLATFKLRAGDIVMGRRGEMGRCAVVTEHEAGWLCGTGSLILRLPECVFPRFFVTLIGSPFVREYLGESAVGATMQNLNQSILLNLVIGLPPLAEQHRIVARVDALMALCDQLEAQITTTEADSRRLLEAVLHEALAPAMEATA